MAGGLDGRPLLIEYPPSSHTRYHSMLSSTAHGRPLIVCYIVLMAVLSLMVIWSPHALVYDKPLHLEGARMLVSGSSTREMLLAPLPSAPGPLYPFLHCVASPLTHLLAPQVRSVNLLLLFLSLAAVAYSLRRTYADDSWTSAGMILGIPMTWVTAGMALTEVPAFSMASFGLAAGAWAARQKMENGWRCYAGFALSGFFAGLSIIGRQTYLPIITVFAIIAVMETRWRWQALTAFMIACVIPVPMFVAWRGLTPPSQAHVGGGIAPEHGLLAFAYLAIVIAIIAPQYYASRWKWCLLAAGGGVLANMLIFRFEWVAAKGLAKFLPPFIQQQYAVLVGSLLVALFIGFVGATLSNLWTKRADELFLLMSVETVLLTSTAFGIVHLFSSRYVMVGFPTVCVMTQPFFKPSKWAMVRAILGAGLGCASLSTYYWQR